ncbi:MAG TPA: DUF4411 family protein [Anaerolineae bacterium]|nr:DUF4411 family protein [Anaerolineae bacterium]
MIYVLDASCFIVLGHYFPARFPSFWEKFNELVSTGSIISVREVHRELDRQAAKPHLRDWIGENKRIFLPPSPSETEFVREIFSNQHFQALLKNRQILTSTPVADPFVIASGYVRNACVVTEETKKPNAAKIPNVCEYYDVDCINLESLMEHECWTF